MAKNVDGIQEGTPVTDCIGSDSYPAVVVSTTPKSVTIRQVDHGANKLKWPDQDYEILLDIFRGPPETFRKGKDGSYHNGSHYLHIGKAVFYQDPNF